MTLASTSEEYCRAGPDIIAGLVFSLQDGTRYSGMAGVLLGMVAPVLPLWLPWYSAFLRPRGPNGPRQPEQIRIRGFGVYCDVGGGAYEGLHKCTWVVMPVFPRAQSRDLLAEEKCPHGEGSMHTSKVCFCSGDADRVRRAPESATAAHRRSG